jgi:hypothetical protein
MNYGNDIKEMPMGVNWINLRKHWWTSCEAETAGIFLIDMPPAVSELIKIYTDAVLIVHVFLLYCSPSYWLWNNRIFSKPNDILFHLFHVWNREKQEGYILLVGQ